MKILPKPMCTSLKTTSTSTTSRRLRLATALNYLRQDNHAEKWIMADKLRIATRWYAEGLPVDKAAAKFGISTQAPQDHIDRYPPKLIFE